MALLKQESKQIKTVIKKLDEVLEQLQVCVSNMSTILQLHESKIGYQSKHFEKFLSLMEERRKEEVGNQKLLHQRISSSEKTLDIKINNTKDSLGVKLNLCEGKLDDRITKLERWKFTAVGGFIVLAFIINIIINYDKVMSLFQ